MIITKNLKKFAQLLKENIENNKKNILIASHKTPDPDSIGSQIALKYILENLNSNLRIDLYNEDIKKDNMLVKFLKDFKKIKNYLPLKFYDILIALEPSSFERVGVDKMYFDKLFVIDHHSSFNKESFKSFEGYIFLEPQADACSSIIYQLSRLFKMHPHIEFKKAILVGILADTLFLRYVKSRETVKIVYELFDKNIRMSDIYNLLFSFKAKDKNLITKAISRIKFIGSIAIIDLSNLHLDKKIQGIFYEFLRFFKDIDLYIFITKKGNTFEYHLRADNYDVSKIATKFQGGGHKNAAAFSTSVDKKKIIKEILKEIKWKV